MKRTLIILLALAVALCGMPALAEGAFEPAASYEVGARSFDAGELTLVPKDAGGGEWLHVWDGGKRARRRGFVYVGLIE